jgi:glycosyltransferase involved in cell wall biosynthesis
VQAGLSPDPTLLSAEADRAHPDMSVVICTHSDDRWSSLEAALDSVRAQRLGPREIVLVIDHNESLLSRARDRWPDVIVVENEERPGLSGARNTGVAAARGSVIAFLDDDAVPEQDWLTGLAAAYVDDSVIAVGGAVEPDWLTARPAWFPDEFAWVVGCSYSGLPTARTAVRNVIGANMSFRREVFDVVGGFRTEVGRVGTIPAGCEETELCIRINRAWPDRSVVYDPTVRVRHRVPPERTSVAYFLSRCYAEGRSKAVVAKLTGSRDALSSEAAYSLRVLPAAVHDALREALGGNRAASKRAGAIVAGFLVTVAGFLAGRAASLLGTSRS